MRKPVLTLLLGENELEAFKDWLDKQHKLLMPTIPEDADLEHETVRICTAIEEILQDCGVEGYEFT